MWGVVPKASTNYFQIPMRQVDRLPYDHFLFGMVTCHSITIMSGELKGDPLDLKMFESTGWQLEEANVSDDTKYDLLFPTTVKPPKDASKLIRGRSEFKEMKQSDVTIKEVHINSLLNLRYNRRGKRVAD